jgi:hypothetical protein
MMSEYQASREELIGAMLFCGALQWLSLMSLAIGYTRCGG